MGQTFVAFSEYQNLDQTDKVQLYDKSQQKLCNQVTAKVIPCVEFEAKGNNCDRNVTETVQIYKQTHTVKKECYIIRKS